MSTSYGNLRNLISKGWIREKHSFFQEPDLMIDWDDDLYNKEPECRCEFLLDGHNQECEYVKWKHSMLKETP
jgi:hypothetical protein